MIGLLDPAFLLPRSGHEAEKQLAEEIDLVMKTCRRHQIAIPPFPEYWDKLWHTLGRALERSVTWPATKQALRQLRRHAEENRHLVQGLPVRGSV